MNAVFEESLKMIFKGKWIEKPDDSYLDDCLENNLLTLYKEYDITIFSVNGVKQASLLNDKGENYVVDPGLFWSLLEWREIKLKSLGI